MTLSLTPFAFRSVQPVAFSARADVHRSHVEDDADGFTAAAMQGTHLLLWYSLCQLLVAL